MWGHVLWRDSLDVRDGSPYNVGELLELPHRHDRIRGIRGAALQNAMHCTQIIRAQRLIPGIQNVIERSKVVSRLHDDVHLRSARERCPVKNLNRLVMSQGRTLDMVHASTPAICNLYKSIETRKVAVFPREKNSRPGR